MSESALHKRGAIHEARSCFKLLKGRDMTQDELDRLELKVADGPADMMGQLRIHPDGSSTFLSPRLDRDHPAKVRSAHE